MQVFDNFSYMFCMVPVLYCIYYSLRQVAYSLNLYLPALPAPPQSFETLSSIITFDVV